MAMLTVAVLLGMVQVHADRYLAGDGDVPGLFSGRPSVVAELVEEAEVEAEAGEAAPPAPPPADIVLFPVPRRHDLRSRVPRAHRPRGPPAVLVPSLHLELSRAPRGPPRA